MRIFSGIQPTGRKHLGNYIGAITQYVAGQDRGDAIYCVVDLHATSVPYEPQGLRAAVYDTAATLLAAGLDPDALHLLSTGRREEHTELCWLLCSVTAWGDLNRMHQFKEKSGRAARPRVRRACSCIRCCRPPTCSPTGPTRFRSGGSAPAHRAHA